MQTTIQPEVPKGNTQANSVVIIRGPHRLTADYATAHAMALQGWSLMRTALGLIAVFTDVQEGSA
ncbi:MAG: hypothetical protein AB7G35_21450 [Hyphomicrobiaceae bacterium]